MSYQEETKEHLEAVKIVEERAIGKVMKLQSENDRLRKANKVFVKTLNNIITGVVQFKVTAQWCAKVADLAIRSESDK